MTRHIGPDQSGHPEHLSAEADKAQEASEDTNVCSGCVDRDDLEAAYHQALARYDAAEADIGTLNDAIRADTAQLNQARREVRQATAEVETLELHVALLEAELGQSLRASREMADATTAALRTMEDGCRGLVEGAYAETLWERERAERAENLVRDLGRQLASCRAATRALLESPELRRIERQEKDKRDASPRRLATPAGAIARQLVASLK